MPIVTFTSDLAGSGYYLAAIKGSILKAFPEVQLVDVSNHIGPLDYKAAAFTIQKAYSYFPDGAIHIVHVNKIWLIGALVRNEQVIKAILIYIYPTCSP